MIGAFDLEPWILVAVNICLLKINAVVSDDETIRLERFDVELYLLPVFECIFVLILINPEQVNIPVIAHQLR